MNKIQFLNITRAIRFRNYGIYPLVVGPLEDNYLPTKYDKREKIVTIFGATGFFGQYLIHELVKHRYQLILPYRGDIHDFKHLRMIGAVSQNLFMPFSVDDDESIATAVEHSDAVINLIGRDFENHYFSFNELHIDVAAKIARISREKGVQSFMQMSALGASQHPKEHLIKAGSQFLKSKWHGEIEVAREFPGAMIVRPASIWGKNDNFIFYFLNRKRVLTGKQINIPLWKYGQQTIKQPVYAEDVSKAIAKILFDDKYKGCTIEAVGPQRFQLDHLVTWFYLNMKHKLENIRISDINDWFLFKAKWSHRFTAHMPHFTDDSLERECITDRLSGAHTLDDLEIGQCKLEDRLQWLVKPFSCIGYRWDEIGGFPPPPSPPLAL